MKLIVFLFVCLLICLRVFAGSFAWGQELPSLEVQQIETGVYLHISYERVDAWGLVASNGVVVVEDDKAFIIDTPISNEDTARLVDWVLEQGFSVEAAVATHFHKDSAGGIETLNAMSIPTYASRLTNDLIAKSGGVPATHSLDGETAWLLEDKIEIHYPGAGHSPDNVVAWMPEQKVLFGGCFVKRKGLGNLGDAVLAYWPQSAENLLTRYADARLVVPGHGKVGDVSLLGTTKQLAEAGLIKSRLEHD